MNSVGLLSFANKFSKLCKADLLEGFEDEPDHASQSYRLELDKDTVEAMVVLGGKLGLINRSMPLIEILKKLHGGESVEIEEADADVLRDIADGILGGDGDHEHAHRVMDALYADGYGERATDPNFTLPEEVTPTLYTDEDTDTEPGLPKF